MGFLTMFHRAMLRLPLSPQERAFLQFLKILIEGAAVSALIAVEPYLTGQPIVPWDFVWHLLLFTFLLAVIHGLGKYVTAHADAAYIPLVAVAEKGIDTWIGPTPTPPAGITVTGAVTRTVQVTSQEVVPDAAPVPREGGAETGTGTAGPVEQQDILTLRMPQVPLPDRTFAPPTTPGWSSPDTRGSGL